MDSDEAKLPRVCIGSIRCTSKWMLAIIGVTGGMSCGFFDFTGFEKPVTMGGKHDLHQ